MCGIIGYVGNRNAVNILLNCLDKLEYRGYDSAGIAIIEDNILRIEKSKGRIKKLRQKVIPLNLTSKIGIGHTRWATHGKPSDMNAHPHSSTSGNIAVIHNGIIENYDKLKTWLINDYDVDFKSDTDTEVIVHLIEHFYENNLLDAVYKAIQLIDGAYALGVISNHDPDTLIAVRKDSPLIVGLGKDENFIASDIPAILKYTSNVLFVENNEVVVIKNNKVSIYNSLKQKVSREVFNVTWESDTADKQGYEHFTIKEIHEQPLVVRNTLYNLLNDDDIFSFKTMKIDESLLENINKLYIVACGSAYHAGLIGKRAIEKLVSIPVLVEIASEFRYSDPFIDEHTLTICVSQSGETLDTLQSLRYAKSKGSRVLSIVNVMGSSVARESDDAIYTCAGPEIGVASTKSFTAQLVCFFALAVKLGILKRSLTDEDYKNWVLQLKELEKKVSSVIDLEEHLQKIASENFFNDNVFFIGRGADVDIAYEASLKLKELSYINSFAIPSGELKHGTIALIEKGTLVITLATQSKLYEKSVSNIKEVKARGAHVIAIVNEVNEDIKEVADDIIYIPKCDDLISPILSVIPMQLFAYYVALYRNKDVDKPRNLAKSVTVE